MLNRGSQVRGPSTLGRVICKCHSGGVLRQANREGWRKAWGRGDGGQTGGGGHRRRGAAVVFSHVDYSTTDADTPAPLCTHQQRRVFWIACTAHCWPMYTSTVVISLHISRNKCFVHLFQRADRKSVLHFYFYHRGFSLLSSGPGCICLYFAANQPPDVREALIRAMIAGPQPSADAKCFPHSFTSSAPYSQTAPAVALLPLCLKGCLIFFLSGQSELPERRLSVYVGSSGCVQLCCGGIFCRSK